MLLSCTSLKGEPHVNNQRIKFRSSRSIGNSWVSRRGVGEGNKGRDEPWSLDKGRDDQVPEEQLGRLCLEPLRYARYLQGYYRNFFER